MTLNRNKKIVISGGPGSGKSTLIQLLQNKGYYCFEEFSRSLLDKSTSEIEKNYFKSKPLEFSELVWKKRLKDLREAEKLRFNKDRPFVFFDRGLLDVIAYLNYINKPFNVNKLNPKNKNYDMVFLLLPPPPPRYMLMIITDRNHLNRLLVFMIILKKLMNILIFEL